MDPGGGTGIKNRLFVADLILTTLALPSVCGDFWDCRSNLSGKYDARGTAYLSTGHYSAQPPPPPPLPPSWIKHFFTPCSVFWTSVCLVLLLIFSLQLGTSALNGSATAPARPERRHLDKDTVRTFCVWHGVHVSDRGWTVKIIKVYRIKLQLTSSTLLFFLLAIIITTASILPPHCLL